MQFLLKQEDKTKRPPVEGGLFCALQFESDELLNRDILFRWFRYFRKPDEVQKSLPVVFDELGDRLRLIFGHGGNRWLEQLRKPGQKGGELLWFRKSDYLRERIFSVFPHHPEIERHLAVIKRVEKLRTRFGFLVLSVRAEGEDFNRFRFGIYHGIVLYFL